MPRRKKNMMSLCKIAVAMAFLAVGIVFGGGSAYAAEHAQSAPINLIEQKMRDACVAEVNSKGFAGAQAFMAGSWLNDSSSDPTNVGITLEAAQTSGTKTVYIWGSVLTCGQGASEIAGLPAMQKVHSSSEPTGVGTTFYGLSFANPSYLNFGNYPVAPTAAGNGRFSNAASITATINISSLTIPAQGGSATNLIMVCTNGVETSTDYVWNFTPSCSSFYVTVTRKAAPIINGTSYRGKTNTDYGASSVALARAPGDPYYFKHELKNTGAAMTSPLATCTITQTISSGTTTSYNCTNRTVGAGQTIVAYDVSSTTPNSPDSTTICQYMTYTNMPNTGSVKTDQQCIVVNRSPASGSTYYSHSCVRRATDIDYTCTGGAPDSYVVLTVLEGQQFNYRFWREGVNNYDNCAAYSPSFPTIYRNNGYCTITATYAAYYFGFGNLGAETRYGSWTPFRNGLRSWTAGQVILDRYYPGSGSTNYLTAGTSGLTVGNTYCHIIDDGGATATLIANEATYFAYSISMPSTPISAGHGGRACAVISRPWSVEPVTLVRKYGTTTWSSSVNILPSERAEFKHALIVRNAGISYAEARAYRFILVYATGSGAPSYPYADAAGSRDQNYGNKGSLMHNETFFGAAAQNGEFVTTSRIFNGSSGVVGGKYCESIYDYAPISYAEVGYGAASWERPGACVNIIDGSSVIGGGGANSGKWRLEGSSKVRGGTVSALTTGTIDIERNQTFSFKHELYARDANMISPTSAYVYQTVNGGSSTLVQNYLNVTKDKDVAVVNLTTSTYSASGYNTGDVVCQYVTYLPSAYNNAGSSSTSKACVKIAGQMWSLNGTSKVRADSAAFGTSNIAIYQDQAFAFQHVVTNLAAGDNMDNNSTWKIMQTVDGGAATQVDTGTGKVNKGVDLLTAANGTKSYTAATSATLVGKRVCQYVTYEPQSANSSAAGSSTPICVTVSIRPWSLTATTKLKLGNGSGTFGTVDLSVFVGDQYSFQHIVQNPSTGGDMNVPATWIVYQTVDGGTPVAVNGGNAQVNRGVVLNSATDQQVYVNTVASEHVGKKVCQYVSYMPPSSSVSTPPSQTTPRCVTVDQKPWELTPASTVRRPGGAESSSIKSKPGEIVTFNHTAKVSGYDMSIDTNYEVHQVVYNATSGAVTQADSVVASGKYKGNLNDLMTKEVQFTITQDQVDRKVCQYLKIDPSKSAGGAKQTTAVCVTVPYNYNLNPFVIFVRAGDFEPGASYSVGKYVDVLAKNTADLGSYATKTKSTTWRLTKFVLRVGGSSTNVPDISGANEKGNACDILPSYVQNCQEIDSDSDDVFIPSSPNGDGAGPNGEESAAGVPIDEVIPHNASVGDKFCYVLGVNPRSDTVPNSQVWTYSKVVCLTVGAKPSVHVLGGGILSSEGIYGAVSRRSKDGVAKTYGSWVEYEAVSNNLVDNFASGASLRGGSTIAYDSSNVDQFNKLTFANQSEFGLVGFSNLHNFDYARLAGVLSSLKNKKEFDAPTDVNLRLYSGETHITATADLNIESTKADGSVANIPKGTVIFIDARGHKVNIAGNIEYKNDGMKSVADIPQVIIMAQEINIGEFVTNVDAWLIAADGGDISTCAKEKSVSMTIPYTGSVYEYKVPSTGKYKLEVWGAEGGSTGNGVGGAGGYSAGEVVLDKGTILKVYMGGRGTASSEGDMTNGGFNGGGYAYGTGGGGGGATDIRIGGDTLYHRLIVAGGGGGDGDYYSSAGSGVGTKGDGGAGGGLNGITGGDNYGTPGIGGTQTGAGAGGTNNGTNGAFGVGGNNTAGDSSGGGGGGGGWYGGGGGGNDYPSYKDNDDSGGGGGSGWVFTENNYNAGYTSATRTGGDWKVANRYFLKNVRVLAGNATMPNTYGEGNMTGNRGDGFVRITALDVAEDMSTSTYESYRLSELKKGVCANSLTINGPVVATGTLRLLRTHVNVGAPGEAAETINLRADANLWIYGFASRAGKLTSTYEQHPAPRY